MSSKREDWCSPQPTSTLIRVGVFALLAATVGANRPSSLGEMHLQAHDEGVDRYSVLAGGHFSRDHKQRQHDVKDAVRGPTIPVAVPGAETSAVAGNLLGKAANVAGVPHGSNKTDFPVLPAEKECDQDFSAASTGACPSKCNFVAESSNQCHFKCVQSDKCGTEATNAENTIPDKKNLICRHCHVEGCKTCVPGAPGKDIEKCKQCMPGYYPSDFDEHGVPRKCVCWTIWIFIVILAFGGICFLVFCIWFLELLSRPVVNEPGLEYGLECRARSRVLQPALTEENAEDGTGPRMLYPFSTNLCNVNVAGPGNVLFFRFQAAILVWAIVLTAVWAIGVHVVDSNLFMLGLMPAKTPQKMCYVVLEGRHMQLKYLWVKVYWLIFAWCFSFLGAIAYGVSCKRVFQTLDNEQLTMADYVALCRSLPVRKGDQPLEQTIKEAIEKETGEKVIGVSVCWNFHEKSGEVKQALEADLGSIEHATGVHGATQRFSPGAGAGAAPIQTEADQDAGCFKRFFDFIQNTTLGNWHCHFHEEGEHVEPQTEEQQAAKVTEMLNNLENTEMAFAVFETEDGRDAALEKTKGNAIPLGEEGFFLESEGHEPDSCHWEDFHVDETQIAARLSKGVMNMAICLCAWTFLLYAPYAHYMGSFSYANGDEPGEMSEGIFIGLVVGSQIGLFVVASIASRQAGFCFEDDKQRTYIVLYNTALIVNLIMDISLTAYLAYHQMCGRGVRTADGRLLADLTTLQEILESYPMQKAVGKNLMKYCWPATFFIPFFAEPFAAQIGPYIVGTLFVRSNKKLTGENAEKALELSEAEQGRYADCIFNAVLVATVPFIASGYMLLIYSAMIFSHIYIYIYDHWRVLRCCSRFWFASDVVSTFAQKLFSIPVGILAAALVFKGNQMMSAHVEAAKCPGPVWEGLCTALGAGPLQGAALWGTMAAAFFGSIFLHVLALEYIVPLFGLPENVNAKEKYEECAKLRPCSWFSSNPVHCLRSKFIFKDDPPQMLCVTGKEHLLKKNLKINAWYEEQQDYAQIEGSKNISAYKRGL